MSITINEVLQLENFKDFQVVAGEKGLDNKIKKVGILDYETKDMIEKNFVEGEFALSTLLNIKDKIEDLYEIVEKLILVGVSGLAIKNIYFDRLPVEVLELANKKSFPIMMFGNAYFEDIITIVMDIIKEKNEREALALKVDNILYSNLNKVIIKKLAYEINREFRENNIVAYCMKRNEKEKSIIGVSPRLEYDKFTQIIPYNEGYLIINTFEDKDSNEITDIVLRRLEVLGFNLKQYVIGISSLHEKLDELDFSIKESIYALRYSNTYEKNISFFNEIGINKLLLPLLDNPWIEKYYDDMIMPLIVYDKRNDTELLKTAIAYVENNGDIKATAIELFQHGNTIRYRIDRINKILSRNYDIDHFYEELAVAIRIHNLMNTTL